jgi:hypothetical protein
MELIYLFSTLTVISIGIIIYGAITLHKLNRAQKHKVA